MQEQRQLRTIKSFVRRQGRMTAGQQRALDLLLPKYAIQQTDGYINFSECYKNENPVIIEIGFGMGHSLFELAQTYPEYNYLGVEVYLAGVGSLLNSIEQQQLRNVRVSHEDAVTLLKQQVPDSSVWGIQLFFPDPWHKKRHHKRRLIQLEFMQLLQQKLLPGGFIHLATDWENYAEQMLLIGNQTKGLVNQSTTQTYVPRPATRPVTKYERRGERLGHGVWDLLFVNSLPYTD